MGLQIELTKLIAIFNRNFNTNPCLTRSIHNLYFLAGVTANVYLICTNIINISALCRLYFPCCSYSQRSELQRPKLCLFIWMVDAESPAETPAREITKHKGIRFFTGELTMLYINCGEFRTNDFSNHSTIRQPTTK